MTQESKLFRVNYFIQEYFHILRFFTAHHNLDYSSRIRFVLTSLYFLVSERYKKQFSNLTAKTSFGNLPLLHYLYENLKRVQEFFSNSEDFVYVEHGSNFTIHVNLHMLLIQENKYSHELKAVLKRANIPVRSLLKASSNNNPEFIYVGKFQYQS